MTALEIVPPYGARLFPQGPGPNDVLVDRHCVTHSCPESRCDRRFHDLSACRHHPSIEDFRGRPWDHWVASRRLLVPDPWCDDRPLEDSPCS